VNESDKFTFVDAMRVGEKEIYAGFHLALLTDSPK
jgi:hypothetical protein